MVVSDVGFICVIWAMAIVSVYAIANIACYDLNKTGKITLFTVLQAYSLAHCLHVLFTFASVGFSNGVQL